MIDMSEKFIPFKMTYDRDDVKKMNDIIEFMIEVGGIPCDILHTTRLMKLKKKGLLNAETWNKEDSKAQFQLKQVDFYTINTCLDVLKKEQMIRKYIDPEFFAERLDFSSVDEGALPFDNWDDHILKLLRKGEEDIFLCERDLLIDDYPECYRRLAYQTAHIKYHYAEKLKEIENKKSQETTATGAIGIALGKEAIYGAVSLSDGDIDIITPRGALAYDGFGSIWNPGVAISEMGLQMRAIKENYEKTYYDSVKSITVSMPALLPDKEDLEKTIADIEESAEQNPDKRIAYNIYKAVHLHDSTARAMVEKATDLADMEHAELEVRALAIAAGYERMDEANKIEGFASALIYDWDKDYFTATLIDGGGYRNELSILNQYVIKNPLGSLSEPSDDANAFVNQLKTSMEKELNKYGLYYDPKKENKKECWDKFYQQTEKITKQIIRNNYGTLLYEDYIVDMAVDYPVSSFEEIFEPFYQQTENIVSKIFSEIRYPESEISRVFLSGEWGNYPYVKKKLETYFGRYTKVCVMDDTALAAVRGAAYLANCSEEKMNKLEENTKNTEKEEYKMGTRTLIPTFFLMSEESVDETEKFVCRKLIRTYDDNIKNQLNGSSSKKKVFGPGSIFNAYLPNLQKVTDGQKYSNEYKYKTNNAELTFYLPEIKNNNRMLYMQLLEDVEEAQDAPIIQELCDIESEEGVREYLEQWKETVFAKVVFRDNGNSKGEFLCLRESYEADWQKNHAKYLVVKDEAIDQTYIFKCWVEELPIPGKSDVPYVYAYVDGSSGDGEKYGSGSILCDKRDVYMSHDYGNDSGRNFTGECISAANVFYYLCENKEKKFAQEKVKELRIFFDNTNVGYVPVELFKHEKEAAKDMWDAIHTFQEKYNKTKVVFIHVDAHTAIYGNEMADRLATVLKEKPGKNKKTEYEKRKKTVDVREKIWLEGDNTFKLFEIM